MDVKNFRLIERTPFGVYLRTIARDSSFMRSSGFRCSLTPELICDELTMTVRNGPTANPVTGDLSPGLGLTSLNLLTVQVAAVDKPVEIDWVSIFHGELRQGGNQYSPDGEQMVLRGLDVRLHETPSLDKAYPLQDGGALIRSLISDMVASDRLSRTVSGPIGTLSIGVGPVIDGVRVNPFYFDAALIPDFGFTAEIKATEQQSVGALLDLIVQQAKAQLGRDYRWGVRPDGKFIFCLVNTAEQTLSVRKPGWKPPVAESGSVYSAVLWVLGVRADGSKLTHLSRSPEAARVGVRAMPPVPLTNQINPWLAVEPTSDGFSGSIATAGLGTASDLVRDGLDSTGVLMTDADPLCLLRIPPGGVERLVVTALSDGVTVTLTRPDGSNAVLPVTVSAQSDVIYPLGQGPVFTSGRTSLIFLTGTNGVDLMGGSVVKIQKNGPAGTVLPLTEARLEVVDRDLLDGLALFYYSIPESSPAAMTVGGLIKPSALTGRVRVPRPAQNDYTAPVGRWEYTYSSKEGFQTTALTGNPDEPASAAAKSLIKRNDLQATSNALNRL